MRLFAKRSVEGFTLIELVIVIIVLAVLAAVAVPKFVNRASFEDYTVRDQLIARLRLVQLQSMNADPAADATSNACYWVVIKSNCFYHEHTSKVANSCNLPSATNVCSDKSYNDYGSVKFPAGMLAEKNYRFDNHGKLFPDNGLKKTISVNGDNGLFINIESEGFIYE